MCVIFTSKLVLEVAFFFGGGGGCRGYFFFIPLCTYLWCVSDVALHWNKCLTTIKLTKMWLTSPTEAFHVGKSPNLKGDKRGTKAFAEGIFSLCPVEDLFLGLGKRRNVQRICLQSFKAVPSSYVEFFFQKKVTQRWWTDILLPQSLSSVALLRSTCCGYGFTACPRDSMAIQLLAAQKSWPPVIFAWVVSTWTHARSGCRRPYWQEIRVSYVKSSCDVTSRDLFLCDSSLLSVERISVKIQCLSS